MWTRLYDVGDSLADGVLHLNPGVHPHRNVHHLMGIEVPGWRISTFRQALMLSLFKFAVDGLDNLRERRCPGTAVQ